MSREQADEGERHPDDEIAEGCGRRDESPEQAGDGAGHKVAEALGGGEEPERRASKLGGGQGGYGGVLGGLDAADGDEGQRRQRPADWADGERDVGQGEQETPAASTRSGP